MTTEKNFQAYFMTQVPHGYRTSLISGGGFPDSLLIHGNQHSFVELKVLYVGKSGDKKLKSSFKPTQPPWYAEYLTKGGKRLFVLFRLNEGYGLLHVDMGFVRAIPEVTYKGLGAFQYTEYETLGAAVCGIWPGEGCAGESVLV